MIGAVLSYVLLSCVIVVALGLVFGVDMDARLPAIKRRPKPARVGPDPADREAWHIARLRDEYMAGKIDIEQYEREVEQWLGMEQMAEDDAADPGVERAWSLLRTNFGQHIEVDTATGEVRERV